MEAGKGTASHLEFYAARLEFGLEFDAYSSLEDCSVPEWLPAAAGP